MPDTLPLRPRDPARLGAYDVLGLLGEGGQGAVFLGRRTDAGPHNDYVAIKLLHAGLTADSPARARFVRELEMAKRVARFCTAQVLDADLAGDQPYIVSEYVSGPSLHTAVTEEGPRRDGALERLAISTLTALTAIHQAGITHRDFKPQNILLGSDGPRVIDFGIARGLGTAADTQTIGTPAYMAPEQFTGKGFGPPADLFAWGGTMVFAATGRPAFGNEDSAVVMHRVLTDGPDLGELPDPLRTVVAACLAKDPADRPTARDAQQALMGVHDLPAPAGGIAGRAGTGPAPASTQEPAEEPAPASPTVPGPAAVPADAFTGTPYGTGPRACSAPSTPDPPTQPVYAAGAAAAFQEPAPPVQAPPYGPVAAPPAGPGGNGQAPSGAGPGGHPHGAPRAHVTRPTGDGASRRRAWPALLVAGVAVAAVTAAGTAWAVTRGDDRAAGGSASPEAAGPQRTQAGGGSGATTARQSGAQAQRTSPGLTTPTPSGGTGDRGTTAQPRQSAPGRPPRPGQPVPPSSGGTPEKPNPYTAQQVCNSGGHGSGYYVQRSSAFTGGRVYQLYNSSGYNCVVTLKTVDVGKKTNVWTRLTRKDGTAAADSGSYTYYAGPSFVYAKGQCVKYSGGTSRGSAGADWGNCG